MARLLRAGLAAAGLLAAAAAAAADPPVELRSPGSVTYEPRSGRWLLEGGALLRRGNLTLRAGRAEWLPGSDELSAEGGVLLAEPGRILAAEALRLRPGGIFEARGVRAWLKDDPLDLSGCATGDDARARGRNKLTFSGDRIAGKRGEPAVILEGARITLCDCGSGPPSWEVRARKADVIPGDRAILDWPVLYVTPRFLGIERPVPVLASPWGYLPLAERQTGLLLPELRFDRNGLGFGLPVFWAISRSWDLTATPEWITGPTRAQIDKAGRGVRGPGLGLELRWAPAPGMDGVLRLHEVYSTLSAWPDGAWRPPGGNRFSLSVKHHQRLSPEAALAADLGFAGDPYYVSDFTGDVILRGAEYRRSALAAWSRGDQVLWAGEAHLLQPLAFLRAAAGDEAPYGTFGTSLSTLQRLPALSATVLPWRVLGPLRVGGTARLTRFAPLRGATGDQGVDGLGPGDRLWGRVEGSSLAPLPRDAGERDGIWQRGERLAATRALARAELSAPVTAWRGLLAEPWAAATAAGYAFDASQAPQATARVAAGLALSTELSRTFGVGEGRLLHVIEPRAEWRTGSAPAGRALPSGYAYDELDVAPAAAQGFQERLPAGAPPGATPLKIPNRALSAAPQVGWQQLRLSVRSRLVTPAGPFPGASVDLEVGQDLDLAASRAAEAFASLSGRAGLVTAVVSARFHAFGAGRPPGSPVPVTSSWLDSFPELRASLSVGGPRLEAHAGFQAWGPGGSQRLAAGPEPFFDPRPIGLDAAALGTLGFKGRWSAAEFAYDLQFTGRTLPTPLVPEGRTGTHVIQQTARINWDSPCRCFKLGVVAWLREGDRYPGATLTFDVGSGEPRGTSQGPLLSR